MLTQERLARLASIVKLDPKTNSFDEIATQYSAVLDYLHILSSVDVADIEPLYAPIEESKNLREDVAIRNENAKNLLKNAPEIKENFFVVPCML